MDTYRDLFRTPEFKPLFVSTSVQVAGTTMSGLALATLVYAATGSPLLSALSMFGPSLAQVLGATLLLSAADRLPPRAALTGLAAIFGIATAALAVPGLPLWAVFAILLGLGMAASVAGGVRYGLLTELLTQDGYLLGRSVLNMSAGAMQIGGFALGGVLLIALSPREALLVAAGLDLVAAAIALVGLSRRAPRAAGRLSARETWRTNRLLWSSPARRHLYLAMWVPNGLIVGCESLFVSYAPRHAGVLFAFAAFGMLLGDTLAGRFLSDQLRSRLTTPLRLLLAAPYLIFFLEPALAVAVLAVTLASVGFSASLMLQERLVALTPEDAHGQALGLQGSGTLAMQGVSAAIAGVLAQLTSPTTAMSVLAVLSVVVTLTLTPVLRRSRMVGPTVDNGRPGESAGRSAGPAATSP